MDTDQQPAACREDRNLGGRARTRQKYPSATPKKRRRAPILTEIKANQSATVKSVNSGWQLMTTGNDNAAERAPVSVSVIYWVGDRETEAKSQTFGVDSVDVPRIGLAEGKTPVKPQAGDYQFSGMHDHGPLIAPKEGGDMAQLIGCIQAAKALNDDYLTKVIQKEKEEKAKQQTDEQPMKRIKTDS